MRDGVLWTGSPWPKSECFTYITNSNFFLVLKQLNIEGARCAGRAGRQLVIVILPCRRWPDDGLPGRNGAIG